MMPMDEMQTSVRRIANWIDVELELPLFYEYVGSLENGDVYLEVGTGITACSSIIAALTAKPGVEVHTVDDGSMWAARGIDEAAYRAKIEGYMMQFDAVEKIDIHIAKSEDFPWSKGIDVLFIDGAHDFASVTTDIVKWTPLVVMGGIAMFHDCLTHKGVGRAVDESMRSDDAWVELDSGGSVCVFRKLA